MGSPKLGRVHCGRSLSLTAANSVGNVAATHPRAEPQKRCNDDDHIVVVQQRLVIVHPCTHTHPYRNLVISPLDHSVSSSGTCGTMA